MDSKQEPLKYVEKGWGSETWFVNKEYCGKILVLKEGKRLSWHYHLKKDEVFYCSKGKVILKYGPTDDIDKAEQTILMPGSHFHIPTGLRHQLIALEDSEVFEASTHHEDDDSIRVIKGD